MIFTYFKTKLFEFIEQKRVRSRFYSNENFKKADLALLEAYEYESPYTICKDFLRQKGAKNVYAYGETPLTTMALIAEECVLGPQDTVIEMGAGRGRGALFLAEYVGCTVVAYEEISTFIERMPVTDRLHPVNQNMFLADFTGATAIYLYGTLLDDEQITYLASRFPQNCKIITVSYPLGDYSEKYRTIKSFPGNFPWGKTEIYLQSRF